MASSVDINEKVKCFTEYFVLEFESKLRWYLNILEGNKKDESGLGVYTTALVEAFTGSPGQIGGLITKKITDSFNDMRNKKIANNMSKLAYDFKNKERKQEIRQILVESAFDIFQSFEMQFMSFEVSIGGDIRAMQKLARCAVWCVLDYYNTVENDENFSVAFITKSLCNNNSSSFAGKVRHNTSKTGSTVMDEENTKLKIVNLYRKSGIITEEKGGTKYYKTKTSNTKKYGYRRCFISELPKKEEVIVDCTMENNQFKDYSYTIFPTMLSTYSEKLLVHLNEEDSELMETRIQECVKNTIHEFLLELTYEDILKEILETICSVERIVANKQLEPVKKEISKTVNYQKNINILSKNIGVFNANFN